MVEEDLGAGGGELGGEEEDYADYEAGAQGGEVEGLEVGDVAVGAVVLYPLAF